MENTQENKPKTASGAKLGRALMGMVLAIIVVCLLIISAKMSHSPLIWWEYGVALFIFMAAFCRLCSVLYQGKLPTISRRFNLLALIFLALTVITWIAEWFLNR